MSINLVCLGELALEKGGSIDPKKFKEEKFDLYSIPAFDKGLPDSLYGSEIGSSMKCVQPGDVMISRIVPHIRRAWVVGPSKGLRQIASSEWIIFRSDRIWPSYLRWTLINDSFHSAFMRTISGVGGSLLRARPSEVYKIKVPLPPLPEQKRIAQILDAADALRAKRRKSIEQLDALVQSTFLEMFGDPIKNPKGWPRYPLEDLCNRVVDCAHSTPKYSDIATDLFCVRSSDIQNGDLVLTDARHVDQSVYDERISRHEPIEGEVIYTREGGRLGFAGLVPAGKKVCLGQRMMLFNASPDVALNTYIWGFLHCSSTYKTVLSMSGGGAAPRVNIKQLKKLSTICPPIDIQEKFQSATQTIQTQKYLLQQHLTELNTLFASLQPRAFNGEL